MTAYQKQLSQLREQLAEVDDRLKRAEDQYSILVNAPTPYVFKDQSLLEKLRSEERDIRRLLGADEGDITQLFREKIKEINKEKRKEERKLEKSKKRLQDIRDKGFNQIDCVSIQNRVKNAAKDLTDIKLFIEELRSEFSLQISLAKKSVMDWEQRVKQIHHHQEQNYAEQIQKLKEQKARLRQEKTEEEERRRAAAEEKKQMIYNTLEQRLNIYREFIKKTQETTVELSNKLESLSLRILEADNRMHIVIDAYGRSIDAASCNDFKTFLLAALRHKRMQTLLDKAADHFEQQGSILKERLEEELAQQNEIVADTGLTRSGLREAIEALRKSNSRERKEFNDKLEDLRSREKQFRRSSESRLEELQNLINNS